MPDHAAGTERICSRDIHRDRDRGSQRGTGNHVENLIVGTIADQNVFNSLTQTDAFGRMNYNGFTQGDFVYRDENNNLQPYFWKSFEISEDGKQIDFTIPLDAVWHDGEPVTMDDVVFTFEYMRDVKKVGSLQNLTEVKVTGDDSASLIFSEPDAYYWINSSCNNNSCVYAKHIWEGIDDPTTLDDRKQPSAVVPTNWFPTIPTLRFPTMRLFRRTIS